MRANKLKVDFLLVECYNCGCGLGNEISDMYHDGYILTKVFNRDDLITKVCRNNNDEDTLNFIEWIKLNFNCSENLFHEDFGYDPKFEKLYGLLEDIYYIFKFELKGNINMELKYISDKELIRGTEHSAGIDLYVKEDTTLYSNYNIRIIETGVKVQIPEGYYGMLCLRSSLGCSGITMPNGVGIIDSDYRGEIKFILFNLSGKVCDLKSGDRIGQLILMKYEKVNLIKVNNLDESIRGEGGFGSTGK